ncbi:MAG: peptidylprolyl isomerase [Pseudomonadales bacterium]
MSNSFWSARYALCAMLMLPMVAPVSAATQLLDKVAVIVEDDIIMESELQGRIAAVTANIQKQQAEMPDLDELRHQVLERMIVESLQLQMGDRAGVRITDAALNDAVENIARSNGMALEQFRAALEAEGSSYVGMRENIRQEMILKRVQQGNVNNRVQITESEVDNFLNSEEGRIMTSPSYRVGHFMIVADESMDSSQRTAAAGAAAQLVAELRSGGAFEELLQSNQYRGFAAQGGDLGWRKKEDLPSIFTEVVPELTVGGVADAIEAGSGWHIVKLMEQRGGEARMVDQTQVRHILIKPSEILTVEEARVKIAGFREQALSGEVEFADLAKQHSEDIGSASEGGELGWTNPGQMVPEFEQVMLNTEQGAISQPFQSQYGWHILRVDDRRSQDMSDRIVKNQASQYIYERKFEEELEAWLQKIRDEAYVDIK